MERRVFIAVILSFVVLYGYQALFPPPKPPAPAEPTTQGTPAAAAPAAVAPAATPATPPATPPATEPAPAAQVAETAPREIVVDTAHARIVLSNVGGRLVPGQSEGGHADFAARTPRELEMVGALTPVFGRVSAEHILSGPGLVNVYRFTHDAIGEEPLDDAAPPPLACAAVGHVSDAAELPAKITASALAAECDRCVEALDLFVSAYGAEAGNMGLRVVATAGVYIGGGIAPRILPALRNGRFMEAFRAKAPSVVVLGP